MKRVTTLRPVARHRLHEAVEARLEEMIVAGKVRPGESLPSENEMAAQLEVSRAVVRDAIRALNAKGLVEIRHGVGTFVTHSGRERLAEALELSLRRGDYTAWEIYSVRRVLELAVVEEAVEKATDEQIAEMRELLDRYRERVKRGDDPPPVDEHTLVHQTMVRCTRNRVLMDLLAPFTVFRVPETSGRKDSDLSHAYLLAYIDDHNAIIDAIERRDVQAAKSAMLKHLAVVRERALCATQELGCMEGI